MFNLKIENATINEGEKNQVVTEDMCFISAVHISQVVVIYKNL